MPMIMRMKVTMNHEDEDAVKMIKVWELCFSIAPGIWWMILESESRYSPAKV